MGSLAWFESRNRGRVEVKPERACYPRRVHLALAMPEGWETRTETSGRRVVVGPGLAVEMDPFAAAPDDARAFVEAAMARELPAGATLRALTTEATQTKDGWPMELARAEIVDAAGATVEVRFAAFYRFNAWFAQALARARSAPELDAARLHEIFLGGRPRWRSRDSVTCLADLWG